MRSAIVEARDVEKSFGAVRAVHGFSLQVADGEILALLGPNGAGKSTVVRMLMKVILPDRGSVVYRLAGAEPAPPGRVQLGYLPEERGLYQDVPVQRMLVYFGTLRGMTRAAASRAATNWLERLGLAERARDPVKSLSKGNQQKVQFIVAVLHGPRFVVLDEPFSGLDPLNQDLFVRLVRELRDDGATVLFSAHQMQLVERLADRLILMQGGRAVLEGTVPALRERWGAGSRLILRVADARPVDFLAAHPAVERIESALNGEVRLRLRPQAPLSALLRDAGARLDITSLHSEQVTLHDIYVETVGAALEPAAGEATETAVEMGA